MIQALRRASFQRLFSASAPAAAASGGASDSVGGVPWARIDALLRHAHDHSDFHRDRLDAAGWPAMSPAAFAKLPPLTRADVAAHADRIAVPNPRSRRGLSRTSGGSGGAAVVIPVDRATYARYTAGTWTGLGWWGVEMPAPTLVLLGASPGSAARDAAKRAKDLLLNWVRVPVRDGFDARVPEARARAERFAPALIYGYPSAVEAVAREAIRSGWRPRRPVRTVLLTGEPIFGFQRRRIARAFGARLAGEYGSGEVGTIAFQCPHLRLHVNTANVCVEVAVDGSLLVTQLHNRQFPLIRYAIGDRGAWDGGPCPCGRPGPLLHVFGRSGDWITDAAGVERDAIGTVDRLFDALPDPLQGAIRIVHPRPGVVAVSAADGKPPDAALAAVRAIFGATFEVNAAPPQPWRRSPSGKLPYFVRGEASP